MKKFIIITAVWIALLTATSAAWYRAGKRDADHWYAQHWIPRPQELPRLPRLSDVINPLDMARTASIGDQELFVSDDHGIVALYCHHFTTDSTALIKYHDGLAPNVWIVLKCDGSDWKETWERSKK